MVKLENVTFRYTEDGPPALQNINLEIRPGESVCVMGANGSGKSTFAKLLAGLIRLRQGQVKITSADAGQIPVALIFQNPDNQMVAVTVEKELAFGLENLGYSQGDMERLIALNLEKFNIAHLRNRLTTELSGGEKQRVALASVMIFRPNILVLDEPDSFLDEEGKTSLKKELANIRAQRPSMVQIHITQYTHVARQYKRLLVFDRGEVVADDAPENVFADTALCIQAGLTFKPDEKATLIVPLVDGYGDRDRAGRVKGIDIRQAGFKYTDNGYVIRNLGCEIGGGEVVGVVGLSGTGKSTLGSLICGLIRPSSGRIVYVGKDSEIISAENVVGRVSGVFQQPERQFFLPTCGEELAFGPKNFGRTLNREQLGALFAMVGLDADDFISRDPFTLSGGEKRRLAFAAVLAVSPDFVVFDEPTCGLDPEGVGRFVVLARRLKSMGTGLVVISHDGQVISSLADRIVLLRSDASNLVMSRDEFFADPGYFRVLSSVEGAPL